MNLQTIHFRAKFYFYNGINHVPGNNLTIRNAKYYNI